MIEDDLSQPYVGYNAVTTCINAKKNRFGGVFICRLELFLYIVKLSLQIFRFRIQSLNNLLEFELFGEKTFHVFYVRRYLIQLIPFDFVILFNTDQPSYCSLRFEVFIFFCFWLVRIWFGLIFGGGRISIGT